MPKKTLKEYTFYSNKGIEFISRWNRHYTIEQLSEHFGISVSSVKRIKSKLNLLDKNNSKHPFNVKTNKRIRRMYYKGYSCLSICKIIKMPEETVRQRLLKMRITLRQRGEKNILYNKYKNQEGYSPTYLRKRIKELYEDNVPILQISKEMHIDKGTVNRRLVAIRLK